MADSAAAARLRARVRVAAPPLYRLFVRNLELMATIGVRRHEQERPQRLRIDIEAWSEDACARSGDDIRRVVDYDALARRVRAYVEGRRNKGLIETLAHELAVELLGDRRIRAVTLRLHKPDILEGEASVGVEVTRFATEGDARLVERYVGASWPLPVQD